MNYNDARMSLRGISEPFTVVVDRGSESVGGRAC